MWEHPVYRLLPAAGPADTPAYRKFHSRRCHILFLVEAGIYDLVVVESRSYSYLLRNRYCSNNQVRGILLCSHMDDYCCYRDRCSHLGYFDTAAVVDNSSTACYYIRARVVGAAADLVAVSLGRRLHLLFRLFHRSGRALVSSSVPS